MTARFSPFKITRADTIVLILACLFLTAIVQLALSNSRFQEYRMTCAKNLSTIGKAMFLYANDYDGEYPRAGGRTTQLSFQVADFAATDRYRAYQLGSNGDGGFATISSSLYLLVKYAEVSPKTFVCPGDSGATVFNPADDGIHDKTPQELWDFGPCFSSRENPSNHCSYSYHMPYGQYFLTSSSNPGMAVAADRNPWIVSTTTDAKDFNIFNPDGDRETVKAGNTSVHEDQGQNVLFVDGHVSFETESFCGVDGDNIYTFKDGDDIRVGSSDVFCKQPIDKTDSLLINDFGTYSGETTKQPQNINSSDLKQTSIVATLDCSLPEHRNVIWCSTFKMAWDKMKDDIIGEPIQVIEAEEMAARLNEAKISPSDLNEDSYYATAGFVKKGIVEQIQAEMRRRFPSEPIPSFNELDVLPQELKNDAVLSYSYINVNVEFEHPFYTNKRKFSFNNQDGTSTNVTSFCNFSKSGTVFKSTKKISEQVDILYYKRGKQRNDSEFAVDLSRQTQPYQVVLAIVPRRASLTDTIADLEKKISEFELDPDYDKLRKFRPKEHQSGESDELIVPDVLYKLTHHFKELEGKGIGNQPWRNERYFIFLAMQMIDFSLSRTGVVLKSEGIFGMTSAIGPPPRYFHFNRPFLIYVKKRGDNYRPFFVMWVDNAELMNLYQDK